MILADNIEKLKFIKPFIYKGVFFILSFFILENCSDNDAKLFRLNGTAFGTYFNFSYIQPHDSLELDSPIISIFKHFDTLISVYKKNSVLSRVNNNYNIKVPFEIEDILRKSKKVNNLSNGYFDPGLGRIFDFKDKDSLNKLLSKGMDSSWFEGIQKVYINEKNEIYKPKNLKINFNAIGEGYALDSISRYLRNKSIDNYVFELGGEVLLHGKNIVEGSNWVVGLDNPESFNLARKTYTIFEPNKDVCITSSGNYRKITNLKDGTKLSHVFNIKTKQFEITDILSVSVFDSICTYADAYSTSILIMGFDKSMEWIDENDISVYIIYKDSDGKMKSYMSPKIRDWEKKK